MNIEIVYYQSPLGVLEIRSSGSAISDVLFANSWKGAKINESELNFTKPKWWRSSGKMAMAHHWE